MTQDLSTHVHGVVVGCRRDDGRWLLIRRSRHVRAPLQVCFPGGAIEAHETPAQAAVREVREELGVSVRLAYQVWRRVFEERPLTLVGFRGVFPDASLTPDPLEVAEVLWLTADEIRRHPDVLPRTDEFLDALLAGQKIACP